MGDVKDMAKVRRHIMIEESLNEKVKSIALKEGCSDGEVINTALRYFIKHGGRDFPELVKIFDAVFKRSSQELLEEMKKGNEEQKRIRFALNDVAKNTGMQNEFWNDYYAKNGVGNIVTTNIRKPTEYEQVEALIMNDLLNQQQNKHS